MGRGFCSRYFADLRPDVRRLIHLLIILLCTSATPCTAQAQTVIPTPKLCNFSTRTSFFIDSAITIIVRRGADERERMTARELSAALFARTRQEFRISEETLDTGGKKAIYLGRASGNSLMDEMLKSIRLTPALHPEGYVLHIDDGRIILAGADDAGIFYGIQTLMQLVRKEGSLYRVPAGDVEDAPDMKYRGLFIENKWGPDLMTLEDYKGLVDRMAELKMNSLAVGLYGCWNVQYRNTITEFYMLPSRLYPELNTPKRIEYYSPRSGMWKQLDYLPALYTDDFFGELIRYGKEHFVTVRPKFNSLGHSTLIPRIHPELSALDSLGNPIEYGFCLSKEATYTFLFNIFDEIIDRYLRPNNITAFDIQLDEVYQWCKCPECRMHTEEERYIRHAIRLAKHLKERGITDIGIWADMLENRKMFNEELVKRIGDAGLRDNLIFQWWEYEGVYPTTRPELGLRTWTVPMTGYLFLYHYSYGLPRITNVYQMLSLGHRDKAEGAESYSIYDPGYHRSTAALAEWAWRKPGAGNEISALTQYRERYARAYYGESWEKARTAFESMDEIYAGYAKGILGAILYYPYSYVMKKPYVKRPYPEEAYRLLDKDPANWDRLSYAARRLEEIETFLRKSVKDNPDNGIALEKLTNVNYIFALAENFLALRDAESKYRRLVMLRDRDVMSTQLSAIEAISTRMRARQLESMLLWETVKPAYLHPYNLRDMSFFLRYLDELDSLVASVQGKISSGDFVAFPPTLVTGTYEEL